MKYIVCLILSFFSLQALALDKSLAFDNDWARGYVQSIDTATTLTVLTAYSEFKVGEILVVQSRDTSQGIIGFVQVESVMTEGDGQFHLRTRLIRHSKFAMIQLGDVLYRMDFNTFHQEYRGTTELIMKNEDPASSSSYKALVFMGLSVGETAQTLRQGEYLINIVGYFDYGVTSKFTVGSVLPGNFLEAPNIQGKYKFIDSDSNVVSLGMNAYQSPDTKEGAVNMTVYWDSVSSENVISHTNLTLALATYDSAKNQTALKIAGTSSLQSGYEFIMSDWNRVLLGPSYHFQNKTVGGYVSYMWIWDHMHLLTGVSTTDISNLIYNVKDGYYFNADLYWRF